MTATKGAGFQPIGPIAPVKASVSLFSVARQLPSENWLTGVTWHRGLNCGDPTGDGSNGPGYRLEFCAGATDLEVPTAGAIPEFYPYDIYVPYACDWVVDEQTYRDDARAALDATSVYHVARELWMGDTEALNPSLISEATDVSAADPVHPITAVGTLLEAWSNCTQQGGDGRFGPVIHAPYSIVTELLAKGVAAEIGDVIHGPAGSLVSPGPGYPTGNAAAPTDGADGADAWVYITGPVEYALGDLQVNPEGDAARFNPRMNRYEVTARRQAIHRFDPCCVFAVAVYQPSPADSATS